jgi:23S rRNA (adenine2503-C2)-methyltransferase
MAIIPTRKSILDEFFPNEPNFRIKQIKAGLFDPKYKNIEDITPLPKQMRETLAEQDFPWMSVRLHKLFESENGDTWKAILKGADERLFETVLMRNKREQWSICVSSQIGCAMKCTFCATGTMGLKRSLTADEITDQYRFWQQFVATREDLDERISNVVFMGMGEPMANYDNVKEAIQTWLDNTDIGPTKITVSSVGILSQLERVLNDDDWPPVRIAISLHSANQTKREEIVPTTVPDFLGHLADWSHRYQTIKGNRNHHITYEYVLLAGVNDTPEIARELATYIAKTGVSKVNVIPYNPVEGKDFTRGDQDRIDEFKDILRARDITVTQRKTMGDDIAAACGQLVIGEQPE